MSKRLYALLLLSSSLLALELSVLGGREEGEPFSTVHIKHDQSFLCEAERNDFEEITSVVCAFKERPSDDFKPLNNNFFSIRTERREDAYFIIVTAHAKMSLEPILFELDEEPVSFRAKTDTARHWMMVGYRETLPLLRREKQLLTAIDFPVLFSHDTMPYVGGLDIQGNPIELARTQDVTEYIAIKNFYDRGDYDKAIEQIDATLKQFPDTIFRSELLLYQIRAYHNKEMSEDLLEASKAFLRRHSADENIPEVLAYTANAYAKIGLYIDADYFFDRLFTEHKGTRYATLGKIYKAEQLVDSGNSKKAILFYEEALNEAQDLDLAAEAAYKITNYYIDFGDKDKAAVYAQKILEGNPDYFGRFLLRSREMALAFANRGRPDIAAGIADALLKEMNKGHEFYEPLFKDRGIWLADAKMTEPAVEALDKYLTTYPYGNFREEVKRAKDALFFAAPESNVSATLASYDELAEKYAGDTIGEKALVKKAELLMEQKRYAEVVEMNATLSALNPEHFPNAADLVEQAATELMKQQLREKSCRDVVTLSKQYDISLDAEWDAGLFECAYVAGDFSRAKEIAGRYIKSSDPAERIAWLYRYTDADFATGNYEEAAVASEDLITLLKMEPEIEYNGIYRIRFDAYQRLGRGDDMIRAITDIERIFGLDFDDIERYTQMVTLAKDRKNSTMIETYAKKVMTLQKRSSSYTQSPYIEFTLAQALTDLGKTDEAYRVVASLESIELDANKRSRAKYLEGSLLQKLGRNGDARKAYEASVEADGESAWGKLAEDALELM